MAPIEQTIVEEFLPRGINDVVWSASIGVIGTVQSVHDVDVARPYLDYAEISLDVEQVLYTGESGAGTAPSPGVDLHFVEYRPGDSGRLAGGLPADLSSDDRFGPPLLPGTRVIVLLAKGTIEVGPGETFESLVPSLGYQSIWTASGEGLAVSVQPSRTVALDQLLATVQEERERGAKDWNDPAAVAEDQATVDNPLGEVVPTTSTAPAPTIRVPALPEVVTSSDDVTLSLDGSDGKVEAFFHGTAAGGIQISTAADGAVLGGLAAPTAASQEGRPLMVNLPSGEVFVALVPLPVFAAVSTGAANRRADASCFQIHRETRASRATLTDGSSWRPMAVVREGNHGTRNEDRRRRGRRRRLWWVPPRRTARPCRRAW